MLTGNSLDNLVRSSLNEQTSAEVPAASVRDRLLVEAARVHTRSSVGPAVPPLVSGLRESADQDHNLPLPRWAGTEQPSAEKWLMMVVPAYAVR